jgi:hypothetical protein
MVTGVASEKERGHQRRPIQYTVVVDCRRPRIQASSCITASAVIRHVVGVS